MTSSIKFTDRKRECLDKGLHINDFITHQQSVAWSVVIESGAREMKKFSHLKDIKTHTHSLNDYGAPGDDDENDSWTGTCVEQRR